MVGLNRGVLRELRRELGMKQITAFGLMKPTEESYNADRRRCRRPDPSSRLLYFTRMTCYSKLTRFLLVPRAVTSQGLALWACPGYVSGFRSVVEAVYEMINALDTYAERRIVGNEVCADNLKR